MYKMKEKSQVVENDNGTGGDMISNRSVRNAEIHEKKIIGKNEKNPVTAMNAPIGANDNPKPSIR